jgi:histone H3/H4
VPEPDQSITTRSAVERFLKKRIRPEARLGPGVIDALVARLTEIGDQAARKADSLARLANRTTILDRDLAEAFDTVAPSAGDQPADPAAVFASLDRMTTEQLGELVRKIQTWLSTRPR